LQHDFLAMNNRCEFGRNLCRRATIQIRQDYNGQLVVRGVVHIGIEALDAAAVFDHGASICGNDHQATGIGATCLLN
jgi:hypothetical protein